jgi:hypothetical protein
MSKNKLNLEFLEIENFNSVRMINEDRRITINVEVLN